MVVVMVVTEPNRQVNRPAPYITEPNYPTRRSTNRFSFFGQPIDVIIIRSTNRCFSFFGNLINMDSNSSNTI